MTNQTKTKFRSQLQTLALGESILTSFPGAAAQAASWSRSTKKRGFYFSSKKTSRGTQITKNSVFSRRELLMDLREKVDQVIRAFDFLETFPAPGSH